MNFSKGLLSMALGAAWGLFVVPHASAQEGPQPPPAPVMAPVHQVTIYNGSLRTVRYVTTGLSWPERELLSKLEAAENHVARLEEMNQLSEIYIYNAMRVDVARTEALVRHYYSPPFAYAQTDAFGYAGAGFPFNYGFGGYGYGYGAFADYFGLYRTVPLPRPNPTAGEAPPGPFKIAAAEALARGISPEAMAAARDHLAMLRRHVITDAHGRVVGVRLDAPHGDAPAVINPPRMPPAGNQPPRQ